MSVLHFQAKHVSVATGEGVCEFDDSRKSNAHFAKRFVDDFGACQRQNEGESERWKHYNVV